jgi:hypothetical protein
LLAKRGGAFPSPFVEGNRSSEGNGPTARQLP